LFGYEVDIDINSSLDNPWEDVLIKEKYFSNSSSLEKSCEELVDKK